jgi:GntR family transcriptional repressor for pyruvate dehydrogenase complex
MDDVGMGRLERAPTYRMVYDAIERRILTGHLKIGDPLPTEMELAEQFGVNRSTVREGIRLLEQGGLVTRDGGKRPRISAPRYQDLASSASRALTLHAVTFRELWEAAMLIEPATAELAARNITAEDLARLRENLEMMEHAVHHLEVGASADTEAFVALDRAFHEILAEAAQNRVLMLAHEPVTTLFIPAGRIILPRLRTWRRVLDAHRRIYAFLADGDAGGAREWMRKHMDDFRRGYAMTGLDFDTPLDAAAYAR